jgi:polyisoprenoid-binding protein YceI
VLRVPMHTAHFQARRGLILAVGLGLTMLVGGPGASSAQEPSAPAATDAGIDGTWVIDTEIGDFSDYSSSWAGFRVAEVLQGLGDVFAVGRTPVVSGSLQAEGSTIQSAVIEVDLTTITSDQSRRDPAIQRALDTVTFPTAVLETRGPVDMGAVPVDGQPFSVMVPATLTIRDTRQDVDLELTGQRVGDVVVVVGTLPVDFTSFGVTMPTAPVVLSVEDTGDLEWQLFFRRGAEPGASGEPVPSPAP